MKSFLCWGFALFLGACTVPSFSVAGDDAGLVAPTCSDSKSNGSETDVDCGGDDCDACALGAHCTRGADCASALCDEGVCAPMPTCSDGTSNGDETDTDCGGGTCDPCELDAHCTRAKDCDSGLCKAGVCAIPSPDPTCSDGQKNGDETDRDCGGSCSPCTVDQRCSIAADCETLSCDSVCQPPSCKDKARNGDETDKDCGGSCSGCDVGSTCKSNTDCQSLSCGHGHCLASSCSDSIVNGNETDTDCGGDSCPACASSAACAKAEDCQSLVCTSKKCALASCDDKVKNGSESEVDCGSGCKGCQTGQFCNTSADCASATCTQNFCVPSSPSGGVVSQAGWLATASESGTGFPPSLAVDGLLSSASRWDSGTAQYSGMWFEVDFGKPQIIFNLTLDDTNRSGDAAQLFDVYTSLTPTFPATPTVKSVSALPKNKVSFPGNSAIVARYVKFVLTQNYAQSHWSIQELTAGN